MRSAQSPQRGMAMVAVVLFSLTLLALAGSMLTSAVAVDSHGRTLNAARRAEMAAESGVHMVLARFAMSDSEKDAMLAAGVVTGTLAGDEDSSRAVRYSVVVSSGASDGQDNDLDGSIDESDESEAIEIASTGTADNVSRTVLVTAMRGVTVFSANAAVYFADPNSEIEFDESRAYFSGIDEDLSGNPTGLLVPGIGVAGDPTRIRNNWPSSKLDDVVGLGGTASIYEVDPLGSIDHILDRATSAPNLDVDETSVTLPGIVYVRSGNEIEIDEGTVRGAGVLIIDGELEIDEGRLYWDGLVIVRNSDEFEVDEGRLEVNGALVFMNRMDELEFDEARINVQYNQAMLNRVVTPVPTGYYLLNWRNGVNP
ncbi:MAG: hypothetical protein AAGD14_16485 [Planctomycetota bacterium]